MASGDTKTNQYLDIAANGTRADLPSDTCCETRSQTLIRGVAERIMDVEDEVEELKNNPDVVDIVDTYADLQAYDTSTLTDKDIIRVLEDSTHDNKSTYYRWTVSGGTGSWAYIGEAGSSITLYTATGTNTDGAMTQKATTNMIYPDGHETDKKRIVIGSGNITDGVRGVSIGKSTIINKGDSPSSTVDAVVVGDEAWVQGSSGVAIGWWAHATSGGAISIGPVSQAGSGDEAVSVGNGANAFGTGAVALGGQAQVDNAPYSVALGKNSVVTSDRSYEVSVGRDGGMMGEDPIYRRISHVANPTFGKDAANKEYVDSVAHEITITGTTLNV